MVRSQYTSEQETAVSGSEKFEQSNYCYESNSFRKEIFLNFEDWQNIPEHKLPCYEYNHNAKERQKTDAVQQMILPCLKRIINTDLTDRQRDIVTKYFLGNYTQDSIAQMLGISQPTVSRLL